MSRLVQCEQEPPSEPVGFASIGDVNRIGARFLEDSFSVAHLEAIQEYRRFRIRCLSTSLQLVECAELPERSLVSVRLKRLDSIRRKMTRQGGSFRLGTLDDVIGIRIICQGLQDVIDLSKCLHQLTVSYRPKDYLYSQHSANTGYRGIHQILRFQQALSQGKYLNVRFEVQLRTFLQHQWAIWSESFGEAIKIGRGDLDQLNHLRQLSTRIKKWEADNPSVFQHELLNFTSTKNVVVAWRHDDVSIPWFEQYGDAEIQAAVDWLNYLETEFPDRRGNALLLVGVSSPSLAIKALGVTHPRYIGGRVLEPEYWMPDI